MTYEELKLLVCRKDTLIVIVNSFEKSANTTKKKCNWEVIICSVILVILIVNHHSIAPLTQYFPGTPKLSLS